MVSTPFSETLTRLRELAGLTQIQLATRSGTAHSSVNRWENGGSLPKRDNAERLDAHLGANGELLSAWRRSATGSALPEWARDLEAIERGARQLSIATPALVPGYLQCEEYARALFQAGHPLAKSEEIDRLVHLRCGRLMELEDLRVTAVFPVSAVSGVADGVRRSQVGHLLKWAGTGRVAVHLVPEGTALLVPTAPLMIFTLASGERAVVSDHADGNVVHDTDTHDRIASWFTSALAASLPGPLSLDALRNLP
ncbi:Scr1 family TA system antitoxin-like transcriptional regulator [Streptomonospora wellingtoniae]|uniref:Scr1 family TA system antitoxin-like transcriptional regulator n=1 Tax=Streptomonospora wellingtoniae TaxID=3075544 RepID=A0ABU2KYC9_9ACTN|nr:Scr1 family TA system antitoxin-like transcriptional regulator [Streptomonospora sp. DSM 45055]MDT0304311.1 Scr1 family TA system antitoxin-like transcriptional regulator [Streptomonospora sp. DSM 45055]